MTFEPKEVQKSKLQEQAINYANQHLSEFISNKSDDEKTEYRSFLKAQANYVVEYANPALPETVAVLLMSDNVSYNYFKNEFSDFEEPNEDYNELYPIRNEVIDLTQELRSQQGSFSNLSKAAKQVYLAVMCASLDKLLGGKIPKSGTLKDAVSEFEYVLEHVKSEEEMFANVAQSKIQELRTFILEKESSPSALAKPVQKNKYKPF